MKLIIGNRAYSSWSMRGWLAMKQSGLEFEELVVPMFDEAWEKRREGDEFAPSLGKVPILWDGDCVVWDSLAIIEFLADRVGRDKYWPTDDAARGMARSMAAEMHSGFANLRRELPMNVRRIIRWCRLLRKCWGWKRTSLTTAPRRDLFRKCARRWFSDRVLSIRRTSQTNR